MNTSVKLEKALENLEKNPYYEKYADRIASLQKTSPEEFMKRIEEQEKKNQELQKKKFSSVDTRCVDNIYNYYLTYWTRWSGKLCVKVK